MSSGRVPINQNNALNLFSSKDQEYEQRSQVLKRLAFVIMCSEQDQFHKHMPDIQGIFKSAKLISLQDLRINWKNFRRKNYR